MKTTANTLNRLSVEKATNLAKALFGDNFYAARRSPLPGRSICEIRYVVPGHTLMVALAGEGSDWVTALAGAKAATGLVRCL